MRRHCWNTKSTKCVAVSYLSARIRTQFTTPKKRKSIKKHRFAESAKGSSPVERRVASKSQLEVRVVDVGVPADWVKVNVNKMKDCYEVYALVPGILREELRVQSDPAGRLVISGQPGQHDNPWGVTPFKKVVSLPTRIDAHQTSAVATLRGQLFVHVVSWTVVISGFKEGGCLIILWGPLLAGCRAQANSGLSEIVAEKGRCSDVEKVRKLMKDRGLKKDMGRSTIELVYKERLVELIS
ncbi:hypothetical protein DH2020_001606 [Rehmannia glutinosa]|uniref:SHSP domain-containing protein n=1 Tax=Rehmannia glutinosa TaxID=99300 RepID=A0ABR0XZV1_REHGL